MASDDVDIHVRLRDAAKFNREAKSVASNIDNIGDQAAQAARRMRSLSAASTTTRVNLGPFSTSLRGGALAVGGFAIAVKKATPLVFSTAEAVATLVGGAGAAGGVGLLALAQGAGVAKLGLADLSDALGGNAAAAKKLSPEVRDLFDTLSDRKKTLGDTARNGLLPGLTRGTESALGNFHVLNRVVGDTGKVLGDLAGEAGGKLGSAEWGRDFGKLGAANVSILDDLGHAGLSLAEALKDVLVEASPLAKWLAHEARDGAHVVELWASSARASGDMARFFREARTDLTLLGSALGHGGHGLINLFGAQDVDGTKTLRNLDRLMARFERWSSSKAVSEGLGQALVDEIPDVAGAAVGALATGMAHAAPQAAEIFLKAFMEADAWGKLLTGAFLFKKLGGFGAAGKLMGRGGGGSPLGLLASRGSSPANPIFVMDVTGGGVPGGRGPGGILGKAGRFGRFGRYARGVGIIGAATAAYEDGRFLWNNVQAENDRTRGWTPEQRRAEASRGMQGIVPLSGIRPARREPVLDSQGFPTGEMRIVVESTVNLDSGKVGHGLSQATIRARARK